MRSGGRLDSLDALRGFDMLFICGLSGLVTKICQLCGSPDGWLATQMRHVKWDGFAHHDTIFPLFLFIAGVTFPFSLAKQREGGVSEGKIWLRTLRRGLLLVLLGLIYNGMLKFDFAHLRIFSVLGRIGLAWMFASWIWLACKMRTRIIWAAAILLGYAALTAFCIAPDFPKASPFSMEGNICGWLDRTLFPNHIYGKIYDPEGLASTVPAIVTALLGMFSGAFIRWEREGLTGGKKTLCLLAAAVALGLAAFGWGRVYPINKALWSSTFVLAAGSYSVAMLALFYWVIDVRGWRWGSLFFRVVGLNSITIYLGQRLIDFSRANQFLFGGVISLFPKNAVGVVTEVGYIATVWLFLYILYRHKVFLKV
ncbi:MAG: DUF5009 domain-containing protein [Kiritimatiellae bacterium]|nr:DUF5009 domain-containing protein [Kiritimatiellia bacterium]